MSVMRDPITPSDHILGDPNAPVTLVEYGDYECGYCGMAHPIVKRVLQHYARRTLRFVFRHFPMTEVHPHAEAAAETAEFCGAYNQFWTAHDALYENQDRLGPPFLLSLVSAIGLDEHELLTALEAGKFAPKVKANFRGGILSGVNGTPTFFINGVRHDAPFDFEYLVAGIDAAQTNSPSTPSRSMFAG
jgi:protein-disulfide isomerase